MIRTTRVCDECDNDGDMVQTLQLRHRREGSVDEEEIAAELCPECMRNLMALILHHTSYDSREKLLDATSADIAWRRIKRIDTGE